MNLELGNVVASPASARAHSRWQPRRGVLRMRFVTSLVAIDLICIVASFFLSHLAIGRSEREDQWVFSLLAIAPLYLLVAINFDAYGKSSLDSPRSSAWHGGRSVIVAAGTVILVAFCLKVSASFSRSILLAGVSASVCSLIPARYFFIRSARRLLGGRPYTTVLLVDGDQRIPPGDYSILIASTSYFDPDCHDPEMYDRLATALSSADRVVVACAPERRNSWAHALKGANIQSEIIVPELSSLAPLGLGGHHDTPTVVVANGPLRLPDRLMKRGFDMLVATGALLAVAPLLVLVALLIKLDSAGPVFFVQTRIGRGNQKFRMLKFRSMVDARSDGHGGRSTMRDDDRVTRIGRFIRKTSIDELPQLLNVLNGDMSIVGPRPHALGSRAADKLFWEIDQRYWHRHAAKPGLTGLAQVRGYRGATHAESDLVNRLQADLEYLDHWSIFKDVWILLRTVGVVFHSNAY